MPPRAGPLALFIVVLWGLNWPASFIALSGMPPLSFRVLTLLLGGIILLLYCLLRCISLRIERQAMQRLLTASFLNVAAWNILSVYAIVELNSARSAILAFTMPFWTVLIELALGQRPTAVQRAAIAISSFGLAGLVLSASFDPSFSGGGAVVMLGAAFAWACGTVYVKRRPVEMAREAFTAWSLLIGAAMVALLLPLQDGPFLLPFAAPIAWPVIAAFAYAALIGMALCQACWFSLLGKLGPVASSLALLGIPPVGVASSWLLVDAPVSLLDLASLGLLVIAAALALTRRAGG